MRGPQEVVCSPRGVLSDPAFHVMFILKSPLLEMQCILWDDSFYVKHTLKEGARQSELLKQHTFKYLLPLLFFCFCFLFFFPTFLFFYTLSFSFIKSAILFVIQNSSFVILDTDSTTCFSERLRSRVSFK